MIWSFLQHYYFVIFILDNFTTLLFDLFALKTPSFLFEKGFAFAKLAILPLLSLEFIYLFYNALFYQLWCFLH